MCHSATKNESKMECLAACPPDDHVDAYLPDNDFDVWSRPICTHVNPDNFVIRVFVVEKSMTAPFLWIHIYQCLSDLSYNDTVGVGCHTETILEVPADVPSCKVLKSTNIKVVQRGANLLKCSFNFHVRNSCTWKVYITYKMEFKHTCHIQVQGIHCPYIELNINVISKLV